MTLEEVISKMRSAVEIGIRCPSVGVRDEVGEFLAEHTGGRLLWRHGGSQTSLVICSSGQVNFDVSAVCCDGDFLYEDITHLLSKEPVAPVVVDDLI